jgi:hypothetical protein
MGRLYSFMMTLTLLGLLYAGEPVHIDSVIINKPVIKGDPFFIWDAKIENDTLCLDITYIGGKKDHIFKLFAFNTKIEQNNFFMDLILNHQANGDKHQAVKSVMLRFDLSPLKRKYQVANNVIRLNLFKLHALNKVQMLTYNF